MRVNSPMTRFEWKVIAVISQDPMAFAQELEGALQELSSEGYDLVSQLPRGSALVITGRRLSLPSPVRTTMPPPPPPLQVPGSRLRMTEMPLARKQGVTTDDVFYYYLEDGEQKSRHFETFVAALRVVRKHLTLEGIVPISLVAATTTRFEVPALPMLFKAFEEDLSQEEEKS